MGLHHGAAPDCQCALRGRYGRHSSNAWKTKMAQFLTTPHPCTRTTPVQARGERQLLSALEALGLPVFERVRSSDGHFLVSCGVALAGASVAVELLPPGCVVEQQDLVPVRVPRPAMLPKAPGSKSSRAETADKIRARQALASAAVAAGAGAEAGASVSGAWRGAVGLQLPSGALLAAFSTPGGAPAGAAERATILAASGVSMQTVLNPKWSKQPNGDADFRRRCLEARGWRVVSILAADWDAAWSDGGVAAAAALVNQRLTAVLLELQRQPPLQ